jgi:hypothetical protein
MADRTVRRQLLLLLHGGTIGPDSGSRAATQKAKEMNGKAKAKVYRSQLMTMSLLRKKRQIKAARC